MSAPDDMACRRDDAIGALPSRQAGDFLDAVDRHLAGVAEYREHGPILEIVDRIVPPFAFCHHAPVESGNTGKLASVEDDPGSGRACAPLAALRLAWFGFAVTRCHRRLLSLMCHVHPETVPSARDSLRDLCGCVRRLMRADDAPGRAPPPARVVSSQPRSRIR